VGWGGGGRPPPPTTRSRDGLRYMTMGWRDFRQNVTQRVNKTSLHKSAFTRLCEYENDA
jgi:hypothetical protein